MYKTESQNHFLLFCICINFSFFTYTHCSVFYRLARQTVQHFSVKRKQFHLPENPKPLESRDPASPWSWTSQAAVEVPSRCTPGSLRHLHPLSTRYTSRFLAVKTGVWEPRNPGAWLKSFLTIGVVLPLQWPLSSLLSLDMWGSSTQHLQQSTQQERLGMHSPNLPTEATLGSGGVHLKSHS